MVEIRTTLTSDFAAAAAFALPYQTGEKSLGELTLEFTTENGVGSFVPDRCLVDSGTVYFDIFQSNEYAVLYTEENYTEGAYWEVDDDNGHYGNVLTITAVEQVTLFDWLVTDRTAADVQKWRQLRDKGYQAMTAAEQAEWTAANIKGAYNISDLNRVGTALNYVRDRLAAISYISPTAFTAKTDWAVTDVVTKDDLTNYLNYVSACREALAQFATTPPTPTYSGGLNYTEANNIEQILIDVDILIDKVQAVKYYCGELYAGEV